MEIPSMKLVEKSEGGKCKIRLVEMNRDKKIKALFKTFCFREIESITIENKKIWRHQEGEGRNFH